MKRVRHFFLLLCTGLASVVAAGQGPAPVHSGELYQALRKLKVLGSVLYIAAHPDDENTRLIAYLSKDRLYRTGYLSLTRGDGGQNLIGQEQGIELGLIRTQELLAARRVDGGEQFFTRAYDFGYSKGPDETFSKWGREKILADVVWVIRSFQPDIIINRFPVTGEGGHGHHTASGILANEAFAAAADPNRFPEQLAYVAPWQVRRVLWNTFNFGGTNTTREDQFKVDVGGYNPLLGKSYGEIAADSRSQHKSQGFGVPASRGESLEYFKTTRGDAPVSDLMDGVDISWERVPGGAGIPLSVDSLLQEFDLLHPEAIVPGLVRLHDRIAALPDSYWKRQKQQEVQQLIAQCAGLFLEATTADPLAIQTDSIRMNFVCNDRLGAAVTLQRIQVEGFDTLFSRSLERNRTFSFSKTLPVPAAMPLTQPYWLSERMEEGSFQVSDQRRIGQPDIDPAWEARFQVRIQSTVFTFIRPVRYKFTDPVKGELYQPVVVVPPVLASPDGDMRIQPSVKEGVRGQLRFTGLKKDLQGVAAARLADRNDLSTGTRFSAGSVTINSRGQLAETDYMLPPATSEQHYVLGLRTAEGGFFYQDRHEIRYDHIPWISYFHEAAVRVRPVDLTVQHKRIGYITGAGDKVPEALEQMGYEVVLLGKKELARTELSGFDAILTGVRAYNTHDWLNGFHEKLMRYVEGGGNLIVQYNTSSQLGPVRARIGPYPFTITRNRITDEQAVVELLKPEHPVFQYPNRITADDFKGWVQERSIYHGSDTAGRYERLMRMADPGEKGDEGSLLVTRYGKGWFTYTGLVFFRQLPAGVPGAFRLLANLIALNKKKGF
ncbi:MAG: hypothetical protein RJA57_1711 [Bacteroidota bacterium]|jgi:LmbE family N-acetylglucosaminyl deacetylase